MTHSHRPGRVQSAFEQAPALTFRGPAPGDGATPWRPAHDEQAPDLGSEPRCQRLLPASLRVQESRSEHLFHFGPVPTTQSANEES